MIKTLPKFIGCVVLAFSWLQLQAQSPYCPPDASDPCSFEVVTSLSFLNITKSEPCDPSGYSDFYDSDMAMLAADPQYQMTVSVGGGIGTSAVMVWFDWNNDDEFDDTEVFNGVGNSLGVDFTVVIVPPTDAVLGVKSGFRVRAFDAAFALGAPGPCNDLGYVETEDYSFFIPNPNLPQCATNLAPNATFECQNVTLSWNTPTTGTVPTEYKVYLGTGGTYDIVNGVSTPDTTFVVPDALAPGTQYDWYVVPSNTEGDAQGCDNPTPFSTNPFSDPVLDLPDGTQEYCVNVPAKIGGLITDGNGDGTTWTYTWTPGTPELTDTDKDSSLFTPAASGDYRFILQITDDSSCVSIDSIDISVSQTPVVLIQGAASNYCYPSVDSLSVSTNSLTIQWQVSSDNVVFSDAENGTGLKFGLPAATGVAYYRVALVNGTCDLFSDTIQTNGVAKPATPNVALTNVDVNGNFCARDSAILKVTNFSTGLEWSTGSTIDSIIVKEAGIYSVTYTETICTSDTAITLGVNAHPAKPVLNIGSTAAICPEETLKAFPDILQDGMVWSTGETTDTITITQNGIYFLNVTNAVGCSTKSEESFVTIGDIKDNPIIETPDGLDFCPGDNTRLVVGNYTSGITWNDVNATQNIQLNVFEAGAFVATFLNADNCEFVSDTVKPSLFTLLETPIIQAEPVNGLCVDSIILLGVENFVSALWNDDNQTQAENILVSTNKLYTASVVSGDGCTSTGEYQLVLSPTPESPAIQVSQGQLVVDPNLGDFFIWYYEGNVVPNENGPAITPGQDGAYSVRAIRGNCEGLISNDFAWPAVGIQAISWNLEFNIYPNPSNGEIHILDTHVQGDRVFQIIDAKGRLNSTFILKQGEDRIHVKSLSGGVYFVQKMSEKPQVSKVIVY
jgi:hypothetical protein